ncbi:hypothetical protein HK100_012166 [Physocladia obscura]|uniref:glucan 1,3-beta-glucosidase n=1 Tax=Physocladia obscura TaxID=109957 RepID=A0AAD5T053_9FUNG|nr:hypothetical protein HK100_012166 [Physocladia obscura]
MSLLVFSLVVTANAYNFVDWKVYKPHGANLGSWLEKEQTHDPVWWASVGGASAPDEWTLCETLGSQCGPIFEARYASFLNTSTIDKLASVGVDLLRIPTTYAAWVDVPGSAFYHGNQQTYLSEIVSYAIDTYDMHVIIGLHSLPGGVNSLDIGEGLLHDAWFYNATNLDYSYQAVDAILTFIVQNGNIDHFTVAPINEASDNLSKFGTTYGLSQNASDYVSAYLHGVLDRISTVDSRIPLMVQDCFKGQDFWVPYFNITDNIVIDVHDYFFAVDNKYAKYVHYDVCGQAAWTAEETTFPVFVGEWALQVKYNNTFAGREEVFNVQRYAWTKYLAGSAFWTAVSYADAAVSGEGVQSDYWSLVKLIDVGVVNAVDTSIDYCANSTDLRTIETLSASAASAFVASASATSASLSPYGAVTNVYASGCVETVFSTFGIAFSILATL